MQEEFEDAKEVLRIRKSKKDRHIGANTVESGVKHHKSNQT
jgi:hypothetical protein